MTDPIATDDPTASGVVVRRPAGPGWEYLVLHRAYEEPAGDWAWTVPTGHRHRSEPVLAGARRELAEETGIGDKPWAVDLSGWWAIWAVTVAPDVTIDLVDAEHDRFEWLTSEQAAERLGPSSVAEQTVSKVDAIPEVDVDFRRMTHDDLPMFVEWQHAPHVRRWFHAGRMDLTEAKRRYGPRIDGDVPTRMWVAQVDGRDVGMVQDYRVGDHDEYAAKTGDPEAAAFDYLIGDPDLVGRGIGTRMVGQFLRELLRPAYPDAPRFLASPDHRNRPSLRLLEKLGFRQGLWIDEPATSEYDPPETEIVCTLDVAHWYG